MKKTAYYINGKIKGDLPQRDIIQTMLRLAMAILYSRLIELIESVEGEGVSQESSNGLVLMPIDSIKRYFQDSAERPIDFVNELFLVRPDVYMSLQFFIVKYQCQSLGVSCASPEEIISDCVTQESTIEYMTLLKEYIRNIMKSDFAEKFYNISRMSFIKARIERENSGRGDSMLKYAVSVDLKLEDTDEVVSVKLFSAGGKS